MGKQAAKVIAVALNPAIDRGIEVPNFAIGAHQMGRQVFRRAAGKAANLARVLNVLNIPTAITGFVGRGEQSYFERQLKGENLSCQLFAVEGKTRENITIMDPEKKVDTHIRDRGFTVAPAALGKLHKKLALICREDDVVCFSGSLPEGMGMEELVELVQICQMRGSRVCVDSGGDILAGCAGLKLYLIKPNLSELSAMLGQEISDEGQLLAATQQLREAVEISLVTRGSEGGYLFSKGADLRGKVPLDPAEVKNTVGCGDAMLGGFLAGQLSGRGLQDSYRLALAVATAAATSVTPAEVNPSEIERFYQTAEVERLTGGGLD